MAAKNARVLEQVRSGPVTALPGAAELIQSLHAKCPVAICSGALRNEIEAMLDAIGWREAFEVIVAGGEVAVGKPDPMGYVETLRRLNALHGAAWTPADCLVVEDAPKVAVNAERVGFAVLGVTTSHARETWPRVRWLSPTLAQADLRATGVPVV